MCACKLSYLASVVRCFEHAALLQEVVQHLMRLLAAWVENRCDPRTAGPQLLPFPCHPAQVVKQHLLPPELLAQLRIAQAEEAAAAAAALAGKAATGASAGAAAQADGGEGLLRTASVRWRLVGRFACIPSLHRHMQLFRRPSGLAWHLHCLSCSSHSPHPTPLAHTGPAADADVAAAPGAHGLGAAPQAALRGPLAQRGERGTGGLLAEGYWPGSSKG